MDTVSYFQGQIISIQRAFPSNVEPSCLPGLQQPLEDNGQDGNGGKGHFYSEPAPFEKSSINCSTVYMILTCNAY